MMDKAGGPVEQGKRRVMLNEAHYHLDFQVMGPFEACWNMSRFLMHGSSHIGQVLYVDAENKSTVFLDEDGIDAEKAEHILSEEEDSQVIAWFRINKKPIDLGDGRRTTDLTFLEVPKYYRFDTASKSFIFRQQDLSHMILPRIHTPPARNLQAIATRLLAMNMCGPTSFDELKTYKGKVYKTCLEAAEARGLMNGIDEWVNVINEIFELDGPTASRRAFAQILLYTCPGKPKLLFDLCYEKLVNQKSTKRSDDEKRAHALRHINFILNNGGMSLADFELDELDVSGNVPDGLTAEEEEDNPNIDLITKTDYELRSNSQYKKLNANQKKFVDRALELGPIGRNTTRLLFVDGPGGTGKTFCYTTIYFAFKAKSIVTICVSHHHLSVSQLFSFF